MNYGRFARVFVISLAFPLGFDRSHSPASADTLDQIRQRGTLRWGGDQEGGGPYIYPRPDDPEVLTGFEVELMDLIGKRLGVRAVFQQCQWDKLPDLLRTEGIDVIANGYELTPNHLQSKIATIPYYVYELQLIARKKDGRIASWDDLKKGGKKKVGVLTGSAAQKYVEEHLGEDVEVIPYDGTTDALKQVADSNCDATVQDVPAAVFYRDRYPSLDFVGQPVGRGYYVLYLRPGDEQLRDALSNAILDLIQTGALRSLYQRYGLWNPAQESLGTPGLGQEITGSSTTQSGWEVLRRNGPILLKAAWRTVELSLLSFPLAILVGLSVALGRVYGPLPLRWLLTWYVEVLRGTPLMLQLYFIFFVLPGLGLHFDAMIAAVIGLAVNYSAYEAEIYRAGLLAIPHGQMEAGLALGMSKATVLRRIIVPQAVRIVVPPVTNDFIALFKDTSVCSVITVVELTKQYNILANSTGAFLELAGVTALLYLLMSYPLSLVARRLEKRVPRMAI